MGYDVIVIGAGLGGLTAGAKLAKDGKKVLVIEQHDRPGGCATTFKRKDFTFEVGLHEMDGLDRTDLKTKIFRELNVFDNVEFLKVPEFYHFVNDKTQITIPHDPEKAVDILIKQFPREKAGIESFFDKIMNARKKNMEENETEQNLGDFLDTIIKDELLKLVLLGNLGYFHDDPYTLSLSYYAAAQGRYFRGGGNYIKGGSQMLSDYLASCIMANGGKVLLNHNVEHIISENGKAKGVEFIPNKSEKEHHKKEYADIIIANVSIPDVVNKLLSENAGNPIKNQIKDMKTGASLLSLYLGFKKPLKELGSQHYSYFIYDESVHKQADILDNNQGPFDKRSFTFIDYSQIDAGLAPKGKSVGVVCCIDYPDIWKSMDKDAYNKEKERVAQSFINRLEKIFPGIKKEIEYYEVATSKTVEKYIKTPNGAVYGFAQTPENVMKEKIVPIENLHFASAWTKIGGGFSGAIYSGYLCAYNIIKAKSRRLK